MKKYYCILFLIISIIIVGCSDNKKIIEDTYKKDDIVILYTANVNCGADEGTTYAGIAAYKKEMKSTYNYVELVDAGNYLSGDLLGTMSNGSYAVDIMNKVGYDIAVLGKRDFYYPVYRLNYLSDAIDFEWLSCNFVNEDSGESVFENYVIEEFGDKKVAFVGVSNPDTYNLRTESQFSDEEGNVLYNFCQDGKGDKLFERVQLCVDEARENGADTVILMSNIGNSHTNSRYSIDALIKNTYGINAVIDGGDLTSCTRKDVKNKNNESVLLTMPGSHLQQFGKLIISDDEITSEMVSDYKKKDKDTSDFIVDEIYKHMQNAQKPIVQIDYSLAIKDEDSNYLVKKQETNLGDLCADAYREAMCADIAFVDAGSIKSEVTDKNFTYLDIEDIFPYKQEICLVSASGKTILNALELGSSQCPYEAANFLQTSGLKYTIDTSIMPAVVVEDGELACVSEKYRVSDITVLNKESGEYEPIDLSKKYTVAISSYIYNTSNKSYMMFNDCEPVLIDEMTDQQALLKYLLIYNHVELPNEYSDINGQGRIIIRDK